MATIAPALRLQFFTKTFPIRFLSRGKVYTYQAGTNIPQATYTNSDGNIPLTNPIILDENGSAEVWLGPAAYRFEIFDENDVLQESVDNVNAQTGFTSVVTVSNLAALRDVEVGSVSLVYVESHTSVNDGGQGYFYFDGSSDGIDNDGTIITPSSAPSTGRWLRLVPDKNLNILWFGCGVGGYISDYLDRAIAASTAGNYDAILIPYWNSSFQINRHHDLGTAYGIITILQGAFSGTGGSISVLGDVDITTDLHFDLTTLSSATIPGHVIDCSYVEWWGAVGDGLTDSTAAFKAAIATGGIVRCLGDEYLITDTLALTKTKLVGQGTGDTDSMQTVLTFQGLGSKTAITITDGTANLDNSLEHIHIRAVSWDNTLGCTSYGVEIDGAAFINNVTVDNFKLSNVFLHGRNDGGGPGGTIIKGLFTNYSGGHGLLLGTGTSNITVIDVYATYNGMGVWSQNPSDRTAEKDGLAILQSGDGNPGDAYPSVKPNNIRILGGICNNNARYGWNIQDVEESIIETGTCSRNLSTGGVGSTQVNLGDGIAKSTINVASCQGGLANINVACLTHQWSNNVWALGKLVAYGADLDSWLQSNDKINIGYTGDPEGAGITDGAYLQYLTESGLNVLRIYQYGTSLIRLGDPTVHIEAGQGQIVLPNGVHVGGTIAAPQATIYTGTGDPNGVVTGNKGDIYMQQDGNGDFYRKSTAGGNTGWLSMISENAPATFTTVTMTKAIINGAAGTNRDLEYQTSGSKRWQIQADNGSESGANHGSDLNINAFDDSGTLIDNPFRISRRASGQIQFYRETRVIDHRFQTTQGADVTAANDLSLGADGNNFLIVGNTQINTIATSGWVTGLPVTLMFSGSPLIKHNQSAGAGFAPIVLSGRSDYKVRPYSVMTFIYDGTYWLEVSRSNNPVTIGVNTTPVTSSGTGASDLMSIDIPQGTAANVGDKFVITGGGTVNPTGGAELIVTIGGTTAFHTGPANWDGGFQIYLEVVFVSTTSLKCNGHFINFYNPSADYKDISVDLTSADRTVKFSLVSAATNGQITQDIMSIVFYPV